MGKKALILNYKILLQHSVASSSQLSYIDTRKEGINLPACLSVCLPLSVCILVLYALHLVSAEQRHDKKWK